MQLAIQDDFCQPPLSEHSSVSPSALLYQCWCARSSRSTPLHLQDPLRSSGVAVALGFAPTNAPCISVQCVGSNLKCMGRIAKLIRSLPFWKAMLALLDNNNKKLLRTGLLETIKNIGSWFYMSVFLYNQIVIIERSHLWRVLIVPHRILFCFIMRVGLKIQVVICRCLELDIVLVATA